jgi:hypothetical protein
MVWLKIMCLTTSLFGGFSLTYKWKTFCPGCGYHFITSWRFLSTIVCLFCCFWGRSCLENWCEMIGGGLGYTAWHGGWGWDWCNASSDWWEGSLTSSLIWKITNDTGNTSHVYACSKVSWASFTLKLWHCETKSLEGQEFIDLSTQKTAQSLVLIMKELSWCSKDGRNLWILIRIFRQLVKPRNA